jgi:hypothetical protein
MSRSALTIQQIKRSAITPSYASANAAGHSFNNGGKEFLHIKTGGTGCVVTMSIPGTVDGQAIADRTYTIGTNSERMIGPFPVDVYEQPGSSDAWVDFDSVTSVTIAAIRL